MGADYVIDYLGHDFTMTGKSYDLIFDVRSNRSPLAYARALTPRGAYVAVGGDTWRLLQALVVGPLVRRVWGKQVKIVALKPNKDLAYMSQLIEAGKLVPVIDRVYTLADVPEALRYFGARDHKGKIVITIA
jgi:NADPH:quinone reductase-like Zn-dependent oxidoreductase